MAIKDANKSNATVDMDTLSNNAPTQESTNQQSDSGQISVSLFGGINPIVPENMGSTYTQTVHDTLEKIYSRYSSDEYKISLITMDNNIIQDIAYSVIVVTLLDRKNSNLSYHALLLAATGEKSPQLDSITTLNPQQPELPTVPADAFDNYLINKIENTIKSVVKDKSIKIFTADGSVLPDNFKIESEADLYPQAANMIKACQLELLRRNPNFSDITIKGAMEAARKSNTQLIIEVNPSRGTTQNEVYLPVRYSWVTELVARSNNYQTRSIHERNQKHRLTRVTGYTDVIPVQTQMPNTTGFIHQMIRYQPHLVVTGVGAEAPTLGTTILALSTALTLTNNNLWLTTIKPQDGDDLHDPGCLNYLANLENNSSGIGERTDFSANNLTEQEVMKVLESFFINNVVFSIDIENYGPETWMLNAFWSAVPTSVTAENAKNAILSAVNHMTGVDMSKRFTGEVVVNAVQLPLGYWTDQNGVQRDLREIDFMAVANTLGPQGDINAINQWAVLSVSDGGNIPQAMMNRFNILKRIVPNAVITGWSTRVTLNPQFLQAVANAIAEAGFTATLSAPTVITNGPDLSMVSDFVTHAALSGGVSPFIQSPGYNGPMYTPNPSVFRQGRGF